MRLSLLLCLSGQAAYTAYVLYQFITALHWTELDRGTVRVVNLEVIWVNIWRVLQRRKER